MGLVEVVMAMAIATAMVGVLAATVTRMMRANLESQQHLQTVVNLGRLGEQFRRDVREAHAASVADAAGDRPGRLVLAGQSDRQITYTGTAGGIERLASGGGQPDHREFYATSGMKFLAWQIAPDNREVAVVLGPLVRRETESDEVRGRFSLSAILAAPQTQAEADRPGDGP
jgi:hypothetical protein